MAIQTIVDEIQNVIKGLEGMRHTPDDPPEQPSGYPFGVTQVGTGRFDSGSLGKILTDESHRVTAFILVNRQDLPRSVQESTPYADLFRAGLQTDPTLNGSVLIVQSVDYSYGPISWGGVDLVGYRFDIEVLANNC